MNDLRQAAQQALEALDDACGDRCNAEYNPCWAREVAETLRAALAEPNRAQKMRDAGYTRRPTLREMAEPTTEDSSAVEPVQEPVALAWSNLEGTKFVGNGEKWKHKDCVVPLCAAPPQRKPLSEEALSKIIDAEIGFNSCCGWEEAFARAVEAAHGIK